MARVTFTQNLRRHVTAPGGEFPGRTVGEVLAAVFAGAPALRGYVLDDQGAVRHHVAVFLNGRQVQDRARLTDPVSGDDSIHVMQALSGG